MLFDKLIILKENTPPKPLVRRIRDRPEWHLLKNPATEIHGRTRLRTLPRKYTEGHGTVSGQTIYFSVFFRVLPWPIVLHIFMKLLK